MILAIWRASGAFLPSILSFERLEFFGPLRAAAIVLARVSRCIRPAGGRLDAYSVVVGTLHRMFSLAAVGRLCRRRIRCTGCARIGSFGFSPLSHYGRSVTRNAGGASANGRRARAAFQPGERSEPFSESRTRRQTPGSAARVGAASRGGGGKAGAERATAIPPPPRASLSDASGGGGELPRRAAPAHAASVASEGYARDF